MELKKVKHYVRRTLELGARASFSLVQNRIKNQIFHSYWRLKARNKKAAHAWKDIVKKHSKETFEDCNQFWISRQRTFDLPLEELKLTIATKVLLQDANDFVNNYFSILGSSKKQFSEIPWHSDIRLQEINPLSQSIFDSSCYYKDITIISGHKDFVKDIKVPWELSRLQHFFVLGYAYYQTNNKKYSDTFINHYNDWLRHNSFMLGANWVCPMDVGIRAVNLVWALFFFKNNNNLSSEFLEKIIPNLYDHFFYLENNWEMYDDLRSSNHYLSDLIGYFYLCYFFYDLPGIQKKAEWCYQELIKEYEKQIFDDGSDYEGSSTYHLLITEIFYHFYILGKKMGFVFDEKFLNKLAGMFSFIDWCTPQKGKTILSIGDNDSGKLLYYGLDQALILSMKKPKIGDCIHFKDFGLSLVKTNEIHYSLRHHVYEDRQPTGHFHNDFGSITLALQGADIFIDSGSYLYTPSAQWRNRFRSVEAHSTFSLNGREPLDFEDSIFDHFIPQQKFLERWIDKNNPMVLHTSHTLYKYKYEITAYRSLTYDCAIKTLKINDIWKTEQDSDSVLIGCWNFILSPFITCKKLNDIFVFEYEGKELATFQSTINFEMKDCFVSLAYGTKVASKRLHALVNIVYNDPVITTITFQRDNYSLNSGLEQKD